MLGLFERFDHLVLPSAQVFPFPVELPWPQAIAGRAMDSYHRWMEVAIPATMAHSPALNAPVGFGTSGPGAPALPMGMQIIGRPQDDLGCLQIGQAYDLATRWPERMPPRLGV